MGFVVYLLLLLEALFALWLIKRSGALKLRSAWIVSVLLLLLAFGARAYMFDYETLDYQNFLTKWVDYFRYHGHFAALRESVGNYNIPYLYFMALFSYSDIPDLYLIKLLSTFFDVLLAYAALLLVRKAGKSLLQAAVCFFLVLLLPTVMLNSAVWGQCDSIFVSLALLGLAYGLPDASTGKEGNPILSMVFIALSFGFKLQAVFIMPVWLLLWIWRKYKWYIFGVFPLTYFLLILPAVLFGRPIKDAILLYADQANTVGDALNYTAPSLTALMRNVQNTENVSAVLIVCAFLTMAAVLLIGITNMKKMTPSVFLALTAVMVLVIPYLLPHMHDRYFYLADIMTAVLFLTRPVTLPVFACMEFGSFLCYYGYIFERYFHLAGNIYLTNGTGAIAVLCAIILCSVFLFQDLLKTRG
jgi:Gpi18-like mannosyltransferase